MSLGDISATKAVSAPTPLALDGLGTHTTCTSRSVTTNNQICDAQLLTTTRGNDVIILVAQCGCDGISSIIDSSGLTFTQRISYGSGNFLGDMLWEYYARATSQLISENITVVFSTDTWRHGIQVFGVKGANTRSIFDPGPNIPATATCPGVGLLPCSISIQTSTIDFVVAGTAINDAGACGDGLGGVPGFTTIMANNGWFDAYYAITTVPKSNVAFNCDGTDVTAILVDAISFRGAFGISSS